MNDKIIYPVGTIPWIILENYKGKDRELLMILLDARLRLNSMGYYDNITLSVNEEQLDSFDRIIQLRLRKEEFFKLNIHTWGGYGYTHMNLSGFYRNKNNKIMGIMIINLEKMFRK